MPLALAAPSAPAPSQDRLRPRGERAAAALPWIAAAYWLGYLLYRVGPWPHAAAELVADAVTLLPNSATLAAAWHRAWALRGRPERARDLRAWALFGLSYACFVGQNVLWLGADVGVWGATATRIGQWLVLGSYLPLVAALVSFPSGQLHGRERTRFWLDWLIVLLGAWLLLWDGVLRRMPQSYGIVSGLVSQGALVADFAVVVTLVALLMRGTLPRLRAPLRLLAIGRAVSVLAGLLTLHLTASGGNSNVWTDSLWVCATAFDFLAAAAWMPHGWRSRIDEADDDEQRREVASSGSALPYAFLAVGYGVLLVESRPAWGTPLGTVVGAAVVLTTVVVARQLLALGDNRRLVRERVAQEARFRSLVQHASDVVTVVDRRGVVRFVSPSLTRVFGHPAVVGADFLDLVHPDDQHIVRDFVGRAMLSDDAMVSTAEWRVRHADGSWRNAETLATNLLADRTVEGIVLNTRDVTERKRLEAELTHRALHDPLTGLANRVLLRDRADHALVRAARGEQPVRAIGVLLIDLDDFKNVNDSLGHGAGDQLLVTVSRRLLGATRGCDTVARLGGDEFAVLLEGMLSDADAVLVAERIVQAMRAPVLLDGKEVVVGTSIGIATAHEGEGVEELLRNADVALYRAKARGKHRYEVFAPEMHAAALARLELEADLRLALAREEFTLAYQPIVELAGGRVIGAEALLRWSHPTRGPVSPAEFVPVAEATGLIVPLGRWVLREACRQAAAWHAAGVVGGASGADALSIAVNLSARQLQDPRIIDDVREALGASGLGPTQLSLEITESVIMHDTDVALARLHALKALGVRLAIDDFGTGYSSLSYLRRFPVDVLKIDRAFVQGAGDGGESVLVDAIVGLGSALGLRTVAEGIEHEGQLARLRALGCGFGQGYLFAAPLPPARFAAMARERVCGCAAAA